MKTKSVLAIMASLAVGYLAGAVFGVPSVGENSGNGNVARLSRKNIPAVSVSPELSEYQEKLMSDSLEMMRESARLQLLTSRMMEFSSLVNLAITSASGIFELEESVNGLISLRQMSDNVAKAGMDAIECFNDFSQGLKTGNASNFEQASGNLVSASQVVARETETGMEFVLAVDNFMTGRDTRDFSKLVFARDMWAAYCSSAPVFEDDEFFSPDFFMD